MAKPAHSRANGLLPKIALIGYGYWGQKIFRYLKNSSLFDLAGVHFRSLANLSEKQISEKYGDKFTADISRIWQDESIGSVFIATPVASHFELVMTALKHNKHVLVEKPLTLIAAEAMQIEELAEAKHLKVLTDYIYTFSRGIQKACQVARDGGIGKINTISMTLRQLGRFTGFDVYPVLASHCLAVLDIFFPLADFEFRRQDLMRTGRAVTTGLISFRSQTENITGFIEVSVNCPKKERRMIFYGDSGTLIYDPFAESTLTIHTYTTGQQGDAAVTSTEQYNYDETNNIERAIETFYDVITEDSPDKLETSLLVTKILEELTTADQIPELPLMENV